MSRGKIQCFTRFVAMRQRGFSTMFLRTTKGKIQGFTRFVAMRRRGFVGADYSFPFPPFSTKHCSGECQFACFSDFCFAWKHHDYTKRPDAVLFCVFSLVAGVKNEDVFVRGCFSEFVLSAWICGVRVEKTCSKCHFKPRNPSGCEKTADPQVRCLCACFYAD